MWVIFDGNNTETLTIDRSSPIMRGTMRPTILLSAAAGLGLLLSPPAQAQVAYTEPVGNTGIYINGTPFSEADIRALQTRLGIPHGAPVPPGRYWYDDVSGLWGQEGGPAAGQLLPGLGLGGRLATDASGGYTPFYINGRSLHPMEVQYLRQLFGYVIPGRYWLDWQGNLGAEGGPLLVNLVAVARSAQGGAAGAYGGYTRRTPFGGLGGDGNCSYYLHPDGPSVMNC